MSGPSALAFELVFCPQESVKAAKRVHVGDLDALADNPQVLLIPEPLDGALHGVDVETDPARELDGRHHQLDGSRMTACHLQERAHDLRLRITQHEDFDLVLGVAQAADQLREDALGELWKTLDDGAQRRLVEREHDAVGQGDSRAEADGPVEDRTFTEEIARAKDRQTPLDHADALEEPDLSLVKQVGMRRGLAFTEEDVALDERTTVLPDEMA